MEVLLYRRPFAMELVDNGIQAVPYYPLVLLTASLLPESSVLRMLAFLTTPLPLLLAIFSAFPGAISLVAAFKAWDPRQ